MIVTTGSGPVEGLVTPTMTEFLGVPFAVPGGLAVPILAGAVILWLLSNATRREFGVEALVVAVATVFYFIRRTGGQL